MNLYFLLYNTMQQNLIRHIISRFILIKSQKTPPLYEYINYKKLDVHKNYLYKKSKINQFLLLIELFITKLTGAL